jgi:hypothetical protein
LRPGGDVRLFIAGQRTCAGLDSNVFNPGNCSSQGYEFKKANVFCCEKPFHVAFDGGQAFEIEHNFCHSQRQNEVREFAQEQQEKAARPAEN